MRHIFTRSGKTESINAIKLTFITKKKEEKVIQSAYSLTQSNDEARNERDDDPDDRSEVVQDEITPDIGDSPQPGASSFSPTEFCVCPGETTLLFDINEAICPLCGKLIDKTVKEATTSAADESGASANGHVDALISTLVQGLVIVPPEASLQDEIFASTQENWSVDTDLPCEEGQGGIKIPVESK